MELKAEATKYFKSFFEAQDQSSVNEQVLTVGLFPLMATEEDIRLLERPCTLV
jgi:hypothetical protein